MQIKAQPFLGFLLNLLGRGVRSFSLAADGVAITGGARDWLGFDALAAAPTVRDGFLSATVALPLDGLNSIHLRGVKKPEAAVFAQQTAEGWRQFNRRRLLAESGRIDHLLNSLRDLEQPGRYPSACLWTALQEDAAALHRAVLAKLTEDTIGTHEYTHLAPIRRFATDAKAMRGEAITSYVAAELARWKEFFDTVESKPLTPEQRLSVVVDEDATLVLAGAGSGKTSVITAKAAYLIKAGIRTPDEILLLAFARDAAKEMSERIEARCGMPVEARTFHALSYDIIGAVEAKKPALADHASDDMAFLAVIKAILRDLVLAASEVAQMIVGWFAHFFDDPREEWDFKTKHDWYSEVEKLDLRTLQGEKVASFEELQIANWLYRNGIAYEYEPVYEHPLPGAGKRV